MREQLSINGRDICDAIPDSSDFGYETVTTSRQSRKQVRAEIDDDSVHHEDLDVEILHDDDQRDDDD